MSTTRIIMLGVNWRLTTANKYTKKARPTQAFLSFYSNETKFLALPVSINSLLLSKLILTMFFTATSV